MVSTELAVGKGCISTWPTWKMSAIWMGEVLAAWAVRSPMVAATAEALRLAISPSVSSDRPK